MKKYFAKAVAMSESTIRMIGEFLIQILGIIFTYAEKKQTRKDDTDPSDR